MFYENFVSACQLRGLKPSPVARECGGTNSSATSWKKGTLPNIEIVTRIAEYLDVPTDFLLKGETSGISAREISLLQNYRKLSEKSKIRIEERIQALREIEETEEKNKSSKSSKINFIQIRHSLNKVSAGTGFELYGEGDNWDEISVPDTYEARNCDYSLTVEGDSMEPLYFDGDIVLIKSQDSILVNQIGVFIVDNELAYIKKLGDDRLISLNDNYDDIYFSESVQPVCKGLVLGKV